MSKCTLEQREEVYSKEYARLAELELIGEDVSKEMDVVKDMLSAITKSKSIVKADNRRDVYTSGFDIVADEIIDEMNRQDPRTRQGKKLTIVSGKVDSNGNPTFKVQYEGNSRIYTRGHYDIVMDQMDAKYGVVRGSDTNSTLEEAIEGEEVIGMGDLINNPTAVKGFTKKLMELDNVKVDENELGVLHGVVDMLVDEMGEYGAKVPVYLNTIADSNNGLIKLDGADDKIEITVGTKMSRFGNDMSAAQRYVHELVHAYTYYAINKGGPETAGLVLKLKRLQDRVMSELTWEDMLPDTSIDPVMEEEVARAQYDYMNSSAFAIEEFMAIALTNPKVNGLISKMEAGRLSQSYEGMTMLGKIKEYFMRLLSGMFEKVTKTPKGMKVDQALLKIAKDLSRANKDVVDRYNNKIVVKVLEGIDDLEEWWGGRIEAIQEWAGMHEVVDLKDMPTGKGAKRAAAKWLLKNSWRLWTNVETRGQLSAMMTILGGGIAFNPEGFIQTLFRHLSDTDEFQDKLEDFGSVRVTIEREREKTAKGVMSMFRGLWDRKMTKAENNAIYHGLLKTDIGALHGIELSELQGILTDGRKLNGMISKVKSEIGYGQNGRADNYIAAQAEGLAEYMVTGKVKSRIQKLTAAEMVKIGGYGKIDEKALDKYITLLALQKQSPGIKSKLKALAEENIEGVMAYGLTHRSALEYDVDATQPTVKGYVKETYDGNVSSKIVDKKTAEWDDLELEGYEEVADIGGGKVLVTNSDRLLDSFNTSAMGLNEGSRLQGYSVLQDVVQDGMTEKERKKEIAREMARLNEEDFIAIDNLMVTGRMDETPGNIVAITNPTTGRVNNYIHTLTTKDKVDHLGMETEPSEILGHMQAGVMDKSATDALNDQLFNELRNDMKSAFSGTMEDLAEITMDNTHDKRYGEFSDSKSLYIRIEEDSEVEFVRNIWKVLPSRMKARINNELPKTGLWVKRSVLLDAFGFRDKNVLTAPVLRELPLFIKKIVGMVERMWKSIVSIFKVDVIMRIPAVLMGNVVSNAMYLLQMGFNPKSIVSMHAQGMLELNRYLDGEKKIAELEAKVVARGVGYTSLQKILQLHADGTNMKAMEEGGLGVQYKKNLVLIKEIGRLKSQQNSSTIKELLDAGLYSAIVEGIEVNDVKSTNRIHRWAAEKMDDVGAPKWVKDGANWMYMSEKTSPFQLMQRATAYSDFMSRYAMYHMSVERVGKKFIRDNGRKMSSRELAVAKGTIKKEIRNAFINYNKPDSAFLQWMNDMGLVMFTKYAIRIQKVIKDGVAKHPVRFLLAALGQEIAGIDLDDIADKSWIERGLSNPVYMPDMTEIPYNAVVPVMLRLDHAF